MRILGLDIATDTGWCIIDDDKMVKYGVIHIPSKMNLCQRLSFFEMNLKQILNDNDINFCCIEDLIMGVSGVKTLSYLGRLGGVALLTCYNKVGNNIKLYGPGEWKAHSFPGINGQAKKVDVQIAVCKFFKLIKEDDLINITKPLDTIKDDFTEINNTIKSLKSQVQKDKSFLVRKRNGPASEQEKKSYINRIKDYQNEIVRLETLVNARKNEIDSIYDSVSLNISSVCGLTTDASDAAGIATCGYNEILKRN